MRIFLLAVLMLALLAGPARADILLIDPASGAATTLVAEDELRIVGWVGDALVVEENFGTERRMRIGPDGSRRRAPEFDRAKTIGPGSQTVRQTKQFELRAPDGHVVETFSLDFFFSDDPTIAWSAGGARLALITSDRLRVLDSATGAVVAEYPAVGGQLGTQAFSPDGGAIVYTNDRDAVRIDVATGKATRLGRANAAAWSASGQVALIRDGSIAVLGAPGVRAGLDRYSDALWSPDGRTIAFGSKQDQTGCSYPLVGVSVAAPGGEPRVLVEPTTRAIRTFAWAPDGRLAVDRGRNYVSATNRRGKRHPWPKRVASRYFVQRRGGNTAIRRVLLRAARSLKAGAARDAVLARMRRDMAPVQRHYDEVSGPLVSEAIGAELDRWLHAAGFARADRDDDYLC